MIYVISANTYMRQCFQALELLGFPWAKDLVEINYGRVFETGTRTQSDNFLHHIIDKAANVMHQRMQKNEEKYGAVENPGKTSLELGTTALKIRYMSSRRCVLDSPSRLEPLLTLHRALDDEFNWDRIKSFGGDSGPYLQYAYVRLASISRKNSHLLPLPPIDQIQTSLLVEWSPAREIAFLLGTYPDVVKAALKTHEPSTVVTFAFRLAHSLARAWDIVLIKGEGDLEGAQAKLYLYECARDVLGAAMRLLGIQPLEYM